MMKLSKGKHNSGHSPGHMSFEVGKSSQKVIVIGDALNNHHVAFRKPGMASFSWHMKRGPRPRP